VPAFTRELAQRTKDEVERALGEGYTVPSGRADGVAHALGIAGKRLDTDRGTMRLRVGLPGFPGLMKRLYDLNEGNCARHTLERLDSFVSRVAGKRLTYKALIA
jgi:hypothetical protein